MSNGELDLYAALGSISPEVADEFPGLRLFWITVPAPSGGSPPAVVSRLGQLSNRFRGDSVVALRSQPVPRAHRAFFRQIGLDPDVDRPPLERAALERLRHGGFRSSGLLADAELLAVIETGIGVWALDAAGVAPGGVGIRATRPGDRLGESKLADDLRPGLLVVADAEQVQALLFGRLAPGHEPQADTRELLLFAVAVDGVPSIHAEEALWVAAEVLSVD